MTTLTFAATTLLGLQFNLDEYTNWYNSPYAALWFWAAFIIVLLLIVALTLWVFRRTRAPEPPARRPRRR
jgi:ABC-type transport system involved in multi-copper enzyme maturation permease subunit